MPFKLTFAGDTLINILIVLFMKIKKPEPLATIVYIIC